MTLNVLQPLFNEMIEEITLLDPGYSGHASDVWSVKTASQEVIVRSSRLRDEPNREFWWGCKFLFGIDPRQKLYFQENAKLLNRISDIPVPNIIAHHILEDREFLIVEKMKGTVLQSFTNQPAELLYHYGRWLAKVHANTYGFYGNLANTRSESKGEFHYALAQAMRLLVQRDYQQDSPIKDRLEPILEELRGLPVPPSFSPILVDMDPSQFLADNGKLSAIVDIEAYVVAPRELDFVGLEYILDHESSKSFVSGYTTILDLPELSSHRRVYRYLYRLLGVQGSVSLDKWLAQPELF
ncbi:aminoglycoside phosphotransferase family protein [Paenibacillus spongiae]|uniref:Aminoglycoside phosphotransferase family protein n=1 Tax=Paenibacillus spongiae TaxID=2909671 RepID=A0ABY5SKE4_9BACL|nr:aminoglycoside phosphotransferase family protein [Paenibacillus spongiae]UVI33145.1 aminoglycoside phosphotransferase family protein [Paenibacillus spongiae]